MTTTFPFQRKMKWISPKKSTVELSSTPLYKVWNCLKEHNWFSSGFSLSRRSGYPGLSQWSIVQAWRLKSKKALTSEGAVFHNRYILLILQLFQWSMKDACTFLIFLRRLSGRIENIDIGVCSEKSRLSETTCLDVQGSFNFSTYLFEIPLPSPGVVALPQRPSKRFTWFLEIYRVACGWNLPFKNATNRRNASLHRDISGVCSGPPAMPHR